jgi:hypothetical protein
VWDVKYNEGDHVHLKGVAMMGLSGTIIKTYRPKTAFGLMKMYAVRLDEGQMRLGHTVLRVAKGNITTGRA